MGNKLITSFEANTNRLRFRSIDKWLHWQESLHFTAIELGLERCRRVANNMGLLNPSYNVISVAGTNGKGSSIIMLDRILRNAGYKIGRYTSPHLLRYNERICINGNQVSDAELCESFDRIDRARGDISLTYFEFGTLAALDLFRQHNVQLAILEVGLGGRLDAVNILDADISLITSIDIDHQEWLGNNRESIGREKAGIFRNLAPAICSEPNPPQSLLDCSEALGTPISILGSDYQFNLINDTWSWSTKDTRIERLPRPMKYCDFQIQNASGVLMLLAKIQDEYPVSTENIKQGLSSFRLKGRFQIIPGAIPKILDVAHNRQSIKALVTNLKMIPCYGKTHIILGMLKDKDHQRVIKELIEITDTWHFVSISQDRGIEAKILTSKLKALGRLENISEYSNVEEALDKIHKLSMPDDRIIITGSFYTVGAAIRYLN
jgi:dihydrofolate synthase/folylpolyglutamate synthase